eukprot:795180-Pelagomonas_calceolata.AAC.3
MNHSVLRCSHPTWQGMFLGRHNTALSLCCEAPRKGEYGSFLVAMDACWRGKLQEQGNEVPENIFRGLHKWVYPNGTLLIEWLLCPRQKLKPRPDAIFMVLSLNRTTHIDPKQMPVQDNDINLAKLERCLTTNPLPSLQKAAGRRRRLPC